MSGLAKAALVRELELIAGQQHVVADPVDLMLYAYDGSVGNALPEVVVFPASTEEVSRIVRLASREQVPYLARGAGTGLSGGSIPERGGIVIGLSRMNRILEIDLANQRAVVEPGVVNLHLSKATAPYGFYFAPDPASQAACTIGGNVAENAGGPHCLAQGVTTNHVLGLELVLPDGEVVELGSKAYEVPGYDLTGLIVGSEGTLGIVTKITVRLKPLPEANKTLLAIFDTVDEASGTVSQITAQGIVPGAIEMMDRLALQAVEANYKAGYPMDASAVLLVELEGVRDSMEQRAGQVAQACGSNSAREVRLARSERERELLWAGRKGAFGAIGRLSPDYYVADGVVPRNTLVQVLRDIERIGRDHRLRIANVFHAGDGNLHPIILFDGRVRGEIERVLSAGFEILRICVGLGGTLSGEHGIGLEKRDAMPLLFNESDMAAMEKIKVLFDRAGLCNPGKIFPTRRLCPEVPPTHRFLPAAAAQTERATTLRKPPVEGW